MPLARLIAIFTIAALSPIGDAVAAVRVPPAEHRPKSADIKTAPALAVRSSDAMRIVLDEPTPSERAALTTGSSDPSGARRPQAGKRIPLVIGFPRAVPEASRSIPLDNLRWVDVPGGRAARIEIAAPGARAVRIALALSRGDPDLTLRFSGNGPRALPWSPTSAATIVEAARRDGVFWSPVLEGDTGIIELHASSDAGRSGLTLTIGPVSHLVIAGDTIARADLKRDADIGSAAACNIDVACVAPSSALTSAANAVGKLVFSNRFGTTSLCTGTLLNDSVTSFTPWLFTASHCVESDPAFLAASVNVYWFFRARTCGSRDPPPYVLQAGGAALLARSEDFDWALLRLNRSPPAGSVFAAWAAEPVPPGAIATGLHHPKGDLAKFSQGTVTGYRTYPDGSSFATVQWSQGTTELGSSGSGLFTFLPGAGHYELRGGLFAGDAACSNPTGSDQYSRLDNMLPLVREYLTPEQPLAQGKVVVVEYYHRVLDRYFITASAHEVNVLDTGALPGWERTGLRFLAYRVPGPVTNPVCRFYRTPSAGSSHFYSADPQECEAARVRFPVDWIFESASVFHIALPHAVSGACPAGTQPVWRFYNQATTSHRYTTDVTIRATLMFDPRWIAEGYGADTVTMCAPTE